MAERTPTTITVTFTRLFRSTPSVHSCTEGVLDVFHESKLITNKRESIICFNTEPTTRATSMNHASRLIPRTQRVPRARVDQPHPCYQASSDLRGIEYPPSHHFDEVGQVHFQAVLCFVHVHRQILKRPRAPQLLYNCKEKNIKKKKRVVKEKKTTGKTSCCFV